MQIKLVNKNQKLTPNNLGTHSGSLSNWFASKTWYPYDALTIGNGATIYLWSDRHGGTLVKIHTYKNGRRFIEVQRDHYKRNEKNEWVFTRDPEGSLEHAEVIDIETEDGQKGFILEPRYYNPTTKRFNVDRHANRISLGKRSEYEDPHF
tara:strand:- start:535 stop:984 length:450 start_codon:yes stop_codon:yes gene_type:complete